MATPRARINIENVDVEPGQTLNVWLLTPDGTTQVELRVTHDGVPEIFCDRVGTQQFANWKPLRQPMPSAGAPEKGGGKT